MPGKRKEKWLKETYEPALKRSPERAKFNLTSGIVVQPLYSADDLSGTDLEESPGYPGVSFRAGHPAHHVPRPSLDDAAIFRLRLGGRVK
jgi:methylmalonyl-CoA mutase N-terminal domain/subunit